MTLLKRFRLVLLLAAGLIVTTACTVSQIMNEYFDDPPRLSPGSVQPGGSQAQPQEESPVPALADTPIPSNNQTGPLKPVKFLNTGTVAATVMPWTFIPLGKETPAVPSDASTVAFPGGNSSAGLSLPLGTYTWCYHWELGDTNNDSYIEYAHAFDLVTVLLDESDPDDPDLAEVVTLVAPSGMSGYPGVCDAGSRSVLDLRAYIVDSRHIDNYYSGYSMMGLAHLDDYVTLEGPITVEYHYRHRPEDSGPMTIDPPVRVSIPAGESQQFYLIERMGEHPGDWNLYIQLISVDG